MKVAIDISPVEGNASVKHRVRGTGMYTRNLIKSLEKYDKENEHTFFTRGEKIPDDVDLIHYPYFEPFFLTLPFFQKKPFVVTVHDLTPLVYPNNFPKGVKGELKWQLQKFNLKKANRIIADSISSKKDIVKYIDVPEGIVDVVYLGASESYKKTEIDKNKRKKIAEKFNIPDKFVLYVGDATWNKNLPRLIRAAISARVTLVMTGKALLDPVIDKSNPWNKDLLVVQEISKNNKNIIRIGFVEDKDLISLYNIATVFVMPSTYEGFGLPILEAMACGCPVITSKEGSIPEVAGDAAYYVDAYNIDSIPEGIRKVFSNADLRKELSEKGIKQAKKFSWKKTAEETLKAYKKAIGNI